MGVRAGLLCGSVDRSSDIMVRHCRVCGKEMESEDAVEKSWMWESSVCSKKCERERKKLREENHECISCGNELPTQYSWDNKKCPECLERDRNGQFYGIYATKFELESGRY